MARVIGLSSIFAACSVAITLLAQDAFSQDQSRNAEVWGPDVGFVVDQGIFETGADRAVRVSDGGSQVWCVDTQWFDQQNHFQYTRDEHFYGAGGAPDAEGKTYVGVKNSEDGTITFRKMKYDGIGRYSELSPGALAWWQLGAIFNPSAASNKEVVSAVSTEDDGLAVWSAAAKQAETTGQFRFVIPDQQQAEHMRGDGYIVNVRWNNDVQAIFNADATEVEFGARQLAAGAYAYSRYVASSDARSNDLCRNGSLFVYGEPTLDYEAPEVSVALHQASASAMGLLGNAIISD